MQRRALLAAPLLAAPRWALAQAPALAFEEALLPGGAPGIQLYARSKRPEGSASPRVALFVHGAVWPGSTAFDLPLAGTSWMDYVAARGFDAWCVDLRGYGRSTRPPEMARPAEGAPAAVRGEAALADLAAAVAAIRTRRGAARVALIGWGWGGSLAARFAAENPGAVERLLLLAPPWPQPGAVPGDVLPAWRAMTRADARAGWLAGVPEGKRAALIPPGWFEHWADATFATDPDGSRQVPSVLRVPNGALADEREFGLAGRPWFDPSRIAAPTLVLAGEWDREAPPEQALELFRRLTAAPAKRLTLLGEATHMAMLERGRGALYQAAQLFLEEAAT